MKNAQKVSEHNSTKATTQIPFKRTQDGIFRAVRQGQNQTFVPITTDGLSPKINQIINIILPNEDKEKIMVLQVDQKECKIDSENWRKPTAISRAIHILKNTGRIPTKQETYLAEALEYLDEDKAQKITEYRFCGWYEKRFLLPGSRSLLPHETVLSQLPYESNEGEEKEALKALHSLFETSQTQSPVLFAALLLAPLLRPLRLPRFGIYLSASAGKGKTEMLKLLMCIFGNRWMGDEMLSFAGTTDNAAIKLAESAKDLPFPIDNFRPQDGHIPILKRITTATMEGKSKARLDRSGSFREQTDVCCLPIITGEDFPEGDAGILGRYLVMDFASKKLNSSTWLDLKKQIEQNFPILGQHWLSYLTSILSKENFIQETEARYKSILDYWHKQVRNQRKQHSQNIERIIKNISALQLSWELALECPTFQEVLGKHNSNFDRGCLDLLDSMINRNEAKSLGVIAIELLKDGLLAKTVHLQKPGHSISSPSPRQENLGWHGEEDTAHLLRTPFVAWLKKQNPSVFDNLSETALSKALEQEELLVSKEEGRYTTNIRVDGRTHRVLHLKLPYETDSFPSA